MASTLSRRAGGGAHDRREGDRAAGETWGSGSPVAPSQGPAMGRCAQCAVPLAHDQRYCTECGAPRGSLPAPAGPPARADAGEREDGRDAQTPDGESAAALFLARLAPSTVGVAVMATLAFGVVIGTTMSPAEQTARTVVVASTQAAAAKRSSPAPESASSSEPARSAAGESPSSGSPAEASPAAGSAAPATTEAPSKGGGSNAKGSPPHRSSGAPAPAPVGVGLPPIRHVFLILLSDQGETAMFGVSSPASYLAKTLAAQGELLSSYYAVAGSGLADEIALVSGQGPTPQTLANCPLYSEIAPGSAGAAEQVIGAGCVYPHGTLTLADQLTAAGRTWKAYVEGSEDAPPGQPSSCRHPALGASDPNQLPTSADPYVTWRNPFVYFDSVTTGPACAQDDVGIAQLSSDLQSASSTPSFSLIVPDACDDGSPEPCAPGAPAGLAPAGAFLERVVPEIERSPAYAEGGLIAITSDHAPQSGPEADSSGCCATPAYPNLPAPAATTPAAATTITTATGTAATGVAGTSAAGTPISAPAATGTSTSGGGKVGLLVISKYVKPGSVNGLGQYNHYSLLSSIERLFGLKPLGYAATPGLLAFDTTVYNAYR
jgi:hypothetical protein